MTRPSRRAALVAGLGVLAAVVGVLVWSGATGRGDAAPSSAPSGRPAESSGATATRTPEGDDAEDEISGEITVLAAASLTDAFTVIVDRFELDHPGVSVTLGTGGSASLAAQVAAGAPVDVLATADERTMRLALDGLATAGLASPSTDGSSTGDSGTTGGDPDVEVFARNTLALAVPLGDPGDVASLADLDRDDVTFAACAVEVPCGAAARDVLAAAGIDRDPVTYESDVTAVLTKVLWGEVDAGLVYASDVRPGAPAVRDGGVRTVPIPDDLNVTTSYPIAVLPRAQESPAARAFVDAVLSDRGVQVLRDAGFLAP